MPENIPPAAADESKKIRNFIKLLSDCTPCEIKLDEKSSPIKIYLRATSYPEELHVRQLVLEIQEWAKTQGLSETSTRDAVMEAVMRMRLYYSARVSWEVSAPRLFQDEREVARLPLNIIFELSTKYHEAFGLSDEELGESLRARTTNS